MWLRWFFYFYFGSSLSPTRLSGAALVGNGGKEQDGDGCGGICASERDVDCGDSGIGRNIK